jgi:hypothetical protein
MNRNAMTRAVVAAVVMWGVMPVAAQAGTITLGGPLPGFRQASLTDAIDGEVGSGNAGVTEVQGYFGGTWAPLGECTTQGGDPCANGALTIDLLSGSWDSKPVSGTWSIASSLPYTDYAISMHVGNGGGEPDHFVWLIANNGVPAGPYSGTWSHDGGPGGAGLSNLKAYGRIGTTTVPDGGTTIGLLGFAMLGLGYLRRRIA